MKEIIFVVKKIDYTSAEHFSVRGTLTCQIQGDTMRITNYSGHPIMFEDCQQEAYRFAQKNNIPYIIADVKIPYIIADENKKYPTFDTFELSCLLAKCGYDYRNNGINQYFIRKVKLK